MYRDDSEALQHRLDDATREADQLRKENEAMRATVGRIHHAPSTTLALPPSAVYTIVDIRSMPLEERARLAAHTVTQFPVWAIGLLSVVTLGVFPLIHFGLLHDRLPRAANNDPSASKSIGFTFIPFYNLYWVFFNALRLSDRLTLQLRLRGLRHAAPRGVVLAACILSVIPWINQLVALPMWTVAACMLQSTANRVARLRTTEWDASTEPSPHAVAMAAMLVPTPVQLEEQTRARRLVNLSHFLGWGGLVGLVFGTIAAAVVLGGPVAGAVGGLSAVCALTGAIVGQIGRGMQSRAI